MLVECQRGLNGAAGEGSKRALLCEEPSGAEEPQLCRSGGLAGGRVAARAIRCGTGLRPTGDPAGSCSAGRD